MVHTIQLFSDSCLILSLQKLHRGCHGFAGCPLPPGLGPAQRGAGARCAHAAQRSLGSARLLRATERENRYSDRSQYGSVASYILLLMISGLCASERTHFCRRNKDFLLHSSRKTYNLPLFIPFPLPVKNSCVHITLSSCPLFLTV